MARRRYGRSKRKYKQVWLKKCKEYFRQFIAFLFSNVGIIGLVVGYTIAGSFVFMTIEGKHIQKVKLEIIGNRSIYAQKLWKVAMDLNSKVMDKEEFVQKIGSALADYQRIVVNYIRRGYDGNDELRNTQWSFAGAFLYSLTVITTIGYGNIFPHTAVGKMITIVYAIIGMPLFLLYLSNIGDIMARSFKWIYAKCCLCIWCPGVAKRRALRKERKQKYESEDSTESDQNSIPTTESSMSEVISEELYDVQNVTVPLTICLAIMVGYICGGAILFCQWETYWTFLDASYFSFISLSTIGFGDLVPGDKIYGRGIDFYSELLEVSFVICSVYLMLGMALIAMCFNLMQEEVIHKIRTTVRTVKYILRCNR